MSRAWTIGEYTFAVVAAIGFGVWVALDAIPASFGFALVWVLGLIQGYLSHRNNT